MLIAHDRLISADDESSPKDKFAPMKTANTKSSKLIHSYWLDCSVYVKDVFADFYANVRLRLPGMRMSIGIRDSNFSSGFSSWVFQKGMNRGCGCFSGPPTRPSPGMGSINWAFI